MTESYAWDQPPDDVEAMVLAAGQYVRASDDLRPRVLEAARLQRGEHRAKRRIRRVSMFVILLAFFTAADWHGFGGRQSHPTGILVAAGFYEVFSPTPAATVRSGDGDWRMIDAFTKWRRQQAQLLRFEI